jgi:hypothetical protein
MLASMAASRISGALAVKSAMGQNAKWLTLAPMFPAVLKADAKPSLQRVYEFAA